MSAADEQNWVEETHRQAKQGDPQAQLNLAYAYSHGRVVPKDLDKAISFARAAEVQSGETAWVELLRILHAENDQRICAVFNERAEPSAQACYIYGHYLHLRGELDEALRIYGLGAAKGHVACALARHALTHRGWLAVIGLPERIALSVRGFFIGWRDENDPRWKI